MLNAQEYQYTPISTAPTTTLVFSGRGLLHTLTINRPLANGVITIYDALTATGTPIATITRPNVLLNDAPVTLTYDVSISTGLTIVTTVAQQNITVAWAQG